MKVKNLHLYILYVLIMLLLCVVFTTRGCGMAMQIIIICRPSDIQEVPWSSHDPPGQCSSQIMWCDALQSQRQQPSSWTDLSFPDDIKLVWCVQPIVWRKPVVCEDHIFIPAADCVQSQNYILMKAILMIVINYMERNPCSTLIVKLLPECSELKGSLTSAAWLTLSGFSLQHSYYYFI